MKEEEKKKEDSIRVRRYKGSGWNEGRGTMRTMEGRDEERQGRRQDEEDGRREKEEER